jgi:hypothetical protein
MLTDLFRAFEDIQSPAEHWFPRFWRFIVLQHSAIAIDGLHSIRLCRKQT